MNRVLHRTFRPSATVVIEPAQVNPPIDNVVVSFAGATAPAILESSLHSTGYDRFSIFACDPVDQFTHDARNPTSVLKALGRHVADYPQVAGPVAATPFVGGWIGYITYEAGAEMERVVEVTRHEPSLLSAKFCLYDAAALYDHNMDQWYLIAVDWPAPLRERRPSVAARLAALHDRLAQASAPPEAAPPAPPRPSTLVASISRDAYLARVERIQRWIEAGDVYQVNLTQRFTADADTDPLSLYRRLRRMNPSSHAALLPWAGAAIVSASPELFLDLRDGRVVTRPIKGTRPRTGDAPLDAIHQRQLGQSDKERAELAMIVDLMRNDLGRVCAFGSIRVTDPGRIEQHPTVFHRVATIEGMLSPGRDWLDLLRASFPGGSVTGAPKIRAMQIIDEIEETPRGVYCGSIGWIGLDGSMSMNIAIRTMLQTRSKVHIYAGGAIVADSEPEQEYEEMLAKASGMFRALNCESPACCHVEEAATVS